MSEFCLTPYTDLQRESLMEGAAIVDQNLRILCEQRRLTLDLDGFIDATAAGMRDRAKKFKVRPLHSLAKFRDAVRLEYYAMPLGATSILDDRVRDLSIDTMAVHVRYWLKSMGWEDIRNRLLWTDRNPKVLLLSNYQIERWLK